MTLAQQFMENNLTKYVFPYQFCEWKEEHAYELTYGARNPHAKYQLNFEDGSTGHVIMTQRQRDGISESFRNGNRQGIHNIGGLGFYSMIPAVANARKVLEAPVSIFQVN